MIELKNDTLVFRAPDVHERARFSIDLQRTLRIPDDGRDYPLPPGLGRFPLHHVDDHASRLPGEWRRRGGVMVPMYQSEALWLNFNGSYPFAVKVAAGKINAVTGAPWSDGLQRDPQDYMVSSRQPWLDGFAVKKGTIRQFVGMPLGSGYSAEEQLTGKAEFGGLQVVAYPMKKEVWKQRFGSQALMRRLGSTMDASSAPGVLACMKPSMGLAPGGRMTQEIYEDPYDFADWDLRHGSRCFIHLTNSLVWRAITGHEPPPTPATAEEYARKGLPWFDYYGLDAKALEGSKRLDGLESVATRSARLGDGALPENVTVTPGDVINVSRRGNEVREGEI